MDEFKVHWWAGPLDGCSKTTGFLPPWWSAPDPGELSKTVWYELVWLNPRLPRYVWRPQGRPSSAPV